MRGSLGRIFKFLPSPVFSLILSAAFGRAANDSVVIRADSQEQIDESHVRASGYVTIQLGGIRLTADEAEFWRDKMLVVAEGNVVFERGDEKIVCRRLELNLGDGTGTFYEASGLAGSDLYFYGSTVEKESEGVYMIHGGAFTSCAQPDPRWQLVAGKARIRRDHHVRLHSVFLKMKSIPVFYSPFLVYPIDEEGRSTGFLLPRMGTSSTKGFYLSESFFWALNRSMDATFTVDSYSARGLGGGGEYRYIQSDSSRGDFSAYLFRDKVQEQQEYTMAFSLNQDLPGGFRAVGNANTFSSFDFQSEFQEGLEEASRRSKKASGSISRGWSQYDFRVSFDFNETDFGDEAARRQVMPQVSLRSREARIGKSPFFFSFATEASSFGRNVGDEPVYYQRVDLAPTVAFPFTDLSFLTFKTSITGRYTTYSDQIDEGGGWGGEGVDRRFFEIRFDAVGPTLARVFDTPGNFYADRYKHVIEPRVQWSYRSRIDSFDQIPKFDSQDYLTGTNQLSFSLVNRFFAKTDSAGDRRVAAPVEFLTWTLSQRYFFDIEASLYDPQFSTPYYSQDGTPSHYSPITSRLSFQPSRQVSAAWNLDYDVNSSRLRSLSLSGNYSNPDWGASTVTWGRTVSFESEQLRSYLRGNTVVNLFRGFQTGFEIDYDLAGRTLNLSRVSLTKNVQCCGFRVEYVRYDFGSLRQETAFRFDVILANLGSFTGFLGGKREGQ